MHAIDKFHKIFPYLVALIITGGGIAAATKADSEDRAIEAYEKAVDVGRENYPELYSNYETYVNNIATEIKLVSSERNILKDFAIYNTLLKNGYISLGDFNPEEAQIELKGLLGANIATGEGVCRNTSVNLCDVFSALGYETKVVGGKFYDEGEDEPSRNNHAVAYVSDGKESYMLDATNETIILRKGYMEYYTITSQEDNYKIFKPDTHYFSNALGEVDSTQLLGDFKNKFNNHWKILKEYQEYEAAAEEYMVFYIAFETNELYSYEKAIDECYDEIAKEYGLK
ncbi:MAG: hypothetical protein J1F35_04970 [Erysipelotrichales bacterium]|nr:hypothetical protein [Erysipelotrichales bacterium]